MAKKTKKQSTTKSALKTSSKKVSPGSARTKLAAVESAGDTPESLFGFSAKGWVQSAKVWAGAESRSGARVWVWVISEHQPQKAMAAIKKQWGSSLAKWQESALTTWLQRSEKANGDSDTMHVTLRDGPVWFLRFPENSTSHRDPLVKSLFARARDCAGAVVASAKSVRAEKILLQFNDANRDEVFGFLVGLELAGYSFAEVRGYKKSMKRPAVIMQSTPAQTASGHGAIDLKKVAGEASRLGVAVNLARHLTNLPGGTLTPKSYAELAQALMDGVRHVKVDVWGEEKLQKEKMNLLLAVGGAAAAGPRLVHLSYRPKERGAEARPIALVGKGVTFDSGGLDLKPSSAMRLMKKDMGGSAAALALTWWAAESGLPLALDTYLALAENAVASRSFRPGDIVKARNGLAIEIHNTDAEGRLVLADAMDVAVTAEGDDAPACVIDLATLTGAIKVGLGTEIAGLFTNSDDLAREIYDAGLKRGDLSWRMPLYQPYKSMLRSNFADHVNAGDGFAGAITAALFLELFARDVPWAHLDIYAWKDSASGAWQEPGGSGQGVMALTEVLSRFVSGKWAEG